MKKIIFGAIFSIFSLALFVVPAFANTPTPFFNGFETDVAGWFTPTRVASGSNGITSATGSWHAEAGGDFTRWGGYTDTFPSGGYKTSVDIYLDVNGGFPNDTRFDWDSAVSDTSGGHRRHEQAEIHR